VVVSIATQLNSTELNSTSSGVELSCVAISGPLEQKFSPSGIHIVLVFVYTKPYRPRNKGVECRWGRQKSRFSTNIWLHRVLSTVRPPSVIHTAAPDRGRLVTLIAGKRRRLLFAGAGRRSVYDKNPQHYNRTEFNCTQWYI